MTGVLAAGVLAEADQTPETKLMTAMEHARLNRAVDRLPSRMQKVVRDVFWKERPIEHIAAELSTSDSTVSRDKHEAFALLRAALG